MAKYEDLFIRSTLSDTNTIPRIGSQSRSPDIIPYGMAPVENPQTFFSSNYNSDVGQDLVSNSRNYLYMRAKNYLAGANSGEFSLYYAPSNVILYPAQWRNNILKTSDGQTKVPVSVAGEGDIAVTNNPFTWVPNIPGSGYHYCLIGVIDTSRHPNPIPNITAISNMAEWVANNGGIGWRNVAVTTKGAATFTTEVPYEQGDEPYQVFFSIECQNTPVGSEVSFSAGTPTGGKPIYLPRTTVTRSDTFNVGMDTYVNAGFETNISYSWWANNTTAPGNMSIAIKARVESNGNDVIAKIGYTPEELGIADALHYDCGRGVCSLHAARGPIKMFTVGEMYTLQG